MLNELQRRLASIYRLDGTPDISDFLIDDGDVEALAPMPARFGSLAEKVLIHEDDEDVSVGVYVADDVLQRLGKANPLEDLSDSALGDLWLVIEGISHFNYIAFNAARDNPVSLMELELQAEIDKYVATLELAIEQGYGDCAVGLRERLFGAARFDEALDAVERERYERANHYASRFCNALSLYRGAEHYRHLARLRDFYRLGQADKVSHIHSLMLAG